MTTTQPQRRTYESKLASYNLDASKLFEIVADLDLYLNIEKHKAEKENPNTFTSVGFRGDGRKLVVSVDSVPQPGFLQACNLADLVLSEDGKSLTFFVYPHEKVAINPSDLEAIAKKYEK